MSVSHCKARLRLKGYCMVLMSRHFRAAFHPQSDCNVCVIEFVSHHRLTGCRSPRFKRLKRIAMSVPALYLLPCGMQGPCACSPELGCQGPANCTDQTVVAEYLVQGDPPSADVPPKEVRKIFNFGRPSASRNGGQIWFGPDGYLYFSSGTVTQCASVQ